MLGNITRDDSRIAAVVDDVANADALFYGLNEVVEKLRVKLLARLEGERFWVSDGSKVPMDKHDCFIVARHPFLLAKKHRRKLAIFEINGKPLIIGSLHLTAYESAQYIEERKQELAEIRKFLHQPESHIDILNPLHQKACGLIREAVSRGNVYLTGDLNLHCLGETDIIYDNGFQDIWLNLHNTKDGVTWDGQKNPLIRMVLPFDNRRMRLDRMISLPITPSTDFEPTAMKITHTDPIASITAPLIGTRLCISDHYGLMMTLSHKQAHTTHAVFDYYTHRQSLLAGRQPATTGYRTMTAILAIRTILAVCMLVLVYVILRRLLIRD